MKEVLSAGYSIKNGRILQQESSRSPDSFLVSRHTHLVRGGSWRCCLQSWFWCCIPASWEVGTWWCSLLCTRQSHWHNAGDNITNPLLTKWVWAKTREAETSL